MNLHEILEKRGYKFRQNIGEHKGWGWFEVNVMELSKRQDGALKIGGVDALKKEMDKYGLWSYPSTDIKEPLELRPDILLSQNGKTNVKLVVSKNNKYLLSFTEKLCELLKNECDVSLEIIDDKNADSNLIDSSDLILIGGSHENRLALKYALLYQTFFLDANVPGDGGYAVTVHTGFNMEKHNILQIAVTSGSEDDVLACVKGVIEKKDSDVYIKNTHVIKQGKVMKENFPSWKEFVDPLPDSSVRMKGKRYDNPDDIVGLSKFLAESLDSGGRQKGFYNVAAFDYAVLAARYYQLSGDRKALELFRELLTRITEYYLIFSDGASYPADLDFRVGTLILHYAVLQHTDVFDAEDRLILDNIFLACSRSIHQYAEVHWPVEFDASSRHNHETFPALNLAYCASYFDRFGLPYTGEWLEYSKSVFSGDAWKRTKNKENSNAYEGFVYVHAALYYLFTGQDLEKILGRQLRGIVERQISATDNFLWAVDYGDSAVGFNPNLSSLACLLATFTEGKVRWFSAEAFARKPFYVLNHIRHGIMGLGLSKPDFTDDVVRWEKQELDPVFCGQADPGFPVKYAFDKLSFRTGWDDEAQYLLFEGVSNEKVSHAHLENNGIERYNQLGRIWVISNGYGKIPGIDNATEAFRKRNTGPEDHNVLIFYKDGEPVKEMPCCNALLQLGQNENILYSTSVMLGYCGCNWTRTLIIAAAHYLIVIDRVEVVNKNFDKAHIEWNCLGETKEIDNGYCLEQQGVCLDICSPSGWQKELGVFENSKSWMDALKHKDYPYADYPMKKIKFNMSDVKNGESLTLITMFSAWKDDHQYKLKSNGENKLIIDGDHSFADGVSIADSDLNIKTGQNSCEISFDPLVKIPDELLAYTKR